MIGAVCWDVGGVFTARPVDAVERIGMAHGIDPGALFGAVFGDYAVDGDHPWHRLERGEVALTDAWGEIEAAVRALGADFGLADLFAGFGDDPTDRSVVTDTLLDLHARGVRMAVVTNNVREFSDGDGGGWRSLVPLHAVEVVVDSSAVGMRKPDPAIYRHVLDELGVAAESAVFVDDMPANVDAARGVGMYGVVCGPDPAPAMAELRALVDDAANPLSSR